MTNARAWLALAALGLLLAAAFAWGIVARIPTVVRADGYLIHTSGVQPVEGQPLDGSRRCSSRRRADRAGAGGRADRAGR